MADSVYPIDPFTGRAVLGGMATGSVTDLILQRQFERDATCGHWDTEAESEADLDRRLDAAGLWQVHRQVEGRPYAITPTDEVKGYRIDRVLVPKPAALDAGWTFGPIGIECKRSGIKIGKPVAQAIDYRRALWHIERSPAVWFSLGFVFVWPILEQAGPIHSVMSQNRVGSATPSEDGGFRLSTGNRCLVAARPSGNHAIDPRADQIGRKVGSR